MTRGVIALVYRCHPEGGHEQVSDETTAVDWLTPDQIRDKMSEVYAIRLLDAIRDDGPHTRSHDGRGLLPAGQ